MRPIGGLFFREAEGLDARKLLAKVCDDGRVTTGDARAATGRELVGFAVHAPRRGFWAIVDSADGALGIGGGDWSKVAIAANHLHTDAIWFRTYAIDLAFAVYLPRGGTWMRAYVGIADDIIQRLDSDGLPVHDARPPALAGDDALLAAVEYEPGTYDTGPDAALAGRLLAIHEALVAGDPAALRESMIGFTEDTLPLPLAIVRGADRGEWRTCVQRAADHILAAPPQMRVKLSRLTLDEELLRRACELATSEAELAPLLAHLDAIETDAETRSSHSHPRGVADLSYDFGKRGAHDLALACTLALLRRNDPAWFTCNQVFNVLLKRGPAKLVLDAPAREAIALVEKRLPELGQSAIDAIAYNLACVYARAGDADGAIAALRRCVDARKQNPQPERDTDLELVWNHPEFASLIDPPPPPAPPPVEPTPEYVVPPEYRVPRLAITFEPTTGDHLIDRLGGRPNAPTAELAWPSSPSRPMQLVAQLVGKAAGGAIDLGDVHVLQIFADLDGDFYELEYHAVIAHRAPCIAVVEPPATVPVADVRAMKLEAGFDDRRLLDDEDFDSEEAHGHAWCDKIGGVPIGANLTPNLPADMRLVLELLSYDDWFLWALFANETNTEFALEVVRG